MNVQPKPYVTPKLVVIGSVTKLTTVIYKQFNSSDGLTYMGTTIGNASV